MAGRENPSYSEGMATTDARCSRSISSACGTGPVNRTASRRASRSRAASAGPPGRAVPTTVSRTGRSVRSFARASSRWTSPLSATSALVITRIESGSRGCPAGGGVNSSGSMPTGMTSMPSGARPISVAMSRREFSDTVVTASRRAATRACMPVKPYQRRRVSRRRSELAAASSSRRSMAIGWWMVARVGRPARTRRSSPQPRDWLSWTRSNSAARGSRCRAARRVKVIGSGKPAVHIVAHSRTSIRSRNSDGRGVRKGSGSR